MSPEHASMKAMVFESYGSPDVLSLQDVGRPEPGDDEVLVQVCAASINEWDWGRLHGHLFANRAMFGFFRPRRKHTILGCDISGRVEAVGSEVTRFAPGDEVFGDLSRSGWSGFAEYAVAPAAALAPKSARMTFEEAAAVPQAGLLALQGLRKGGIAAGQRVLVNGAGGGAGTFAIQIAKHIGTEVTGVDSAAKLEVMRSLGADHVIDYADQDFTRTGETYDLILDVMSRRSPSDYRRALSPGGTCSVVGGSTSAIQKTVFLGWRGDRKTRLLLYKPSTADLERMNELHEAGHVRPVIDRLYPLGELADAFRYYESGRHTGKLVVTIASPSEARG